jgi:ferredoxin-NADP reductase
MGAQNSPARSSYRARIERIFDHNDDTRSIFMRVAPERTLKIVPGQFISILIPLADEILRRPYSIASPRQTDLIEICFNRVPNGRGVGWLFDRAAGEDLEFMGPFGTFTLDQPPQIETIFIAEGTAIAPIRPMLHHARSQNHAAMFLLYAARDRDHILYRDELNELAGSRDTTFSFETMFPDGSASDLYQLLHDEVARRWVNADTDRARQFYICGVGKGVSRIRDLLRGSGYERRAVHYEQW